MLQRMRASEEEDASKIKKMRASVVMRVDDAMEMNERASCARKSLIYINRKNLPVCYTDLKTIINLILTSFYFTFTQV